MIVCASATSSPGAGTPAGNGASPTDQGGGHPEQQLPVFEAVHCCAPHEINGNEIYRTESSTRRIGCLRGAGSGGRTSGSSSNSSPMSRRRSRSVALMTHLLPELCFVGERRNRDSRAPSKSGGLPVVVELTGAGLFDPDPYRVAREVVSPPDHMRRLPGSVLGDHLALELDAVFGGLGTDLLASKALCNPKAHSTSQPGRALPKAKRTPTPETIGYACHGWSGKRALATLADHCFALTA